MYDALHLKKYWGWYHKQQRENSFDGFKKVIQAPLQHIFGDYNLCGAW